MEKMLNKDKVEGNCINCEYPIDSELNAQKRLNWNNGVWGRKTERRFHLKLCIKCFEVKFTEEIKKSIKKNKKPHYDVRVWHA